MVQVSDTTMERKTGRPDAPGRESGFSPGEQAARNRRLRTTVLFGLAGLAVSLIIGWYVLRTGTPKFRGTFAAFAGWMSAGTVLGLAGRVARRRVFFKGRLSLHEAASFDAIFQGAILLHPQLPYPSVEAEFLRRETGEPSEAVMAWFRIRTISASAIPLSLGAIVTAAAGQWSAAALFCTAAALVVAFSGGGTKGSGVGRRRLAAAVVLGICAAAGEGLGFVAASRALQPSLPVWSGMLLYLVTLAAFELSPVPLALGVLEGVYLMPALIGGFPLPGLILPVAYRLWRSLPVVLLTLFYLPRYKLSLLDLFDPGLALALAQTRRPEGGWEEAVEPDAPTLSVVIPAYNEEGRLPHYLPEVVAFGETLEGGAEVLVVDDGSSDGTVRYVESVAQRHAQVRLLRQATNQGKGAAVCRGMIEARGRYVLFADADGSTPIREASKLISVARSGVEVVIASRKGGGHVERSFLRGLMGVVFYRLTNLLAVPGVTDTQCGFKLFRRVAARTLFPLVRESGWAFDVEVLFLAQKFGLAIAEVPVDWTAVEGSKLHPVKDAVNMVIAILRIRRRDSGLSGTMKFGGAGPTAP
jgi:dolichyl-phosphate beta-glucosyltransferase